jgi:hypothetical protein
VSWIWTAARLKWRLIVEHTTIEIKRSHPFLRDFADGAIVRVAFGSGREAARLCIIAMQMTQPFRFQLFVDLEG